ncbi:MAG: hemerythrin domain-containing protein [Acidiferrobacter sp.]
MVQISDRSDGVVPSFDDPLGLLAACHDRINGHCAMLLQLRGYLGTYGCDQTAQQAAEQVRRYFAQAGRWHHEDEEVDLGPLLAGHGDAHFVTTMADVLAEHHVLDSAYEPLAIALRAVCAGGFVGDLPVEPFVSLTRRHILIEEESVLRPARWLLSPAEISRLGAAMAARRGVSPMPPTTPQGRR